MSKRRKRVAKKKFILGSIREAVEQVEEIDMSFAMEDHINVELSDLYEKADAELGLQQTKRDQLITIYIALLAFLTPAVLDATQIKPLVQGFLFLAAAIVGIMFSLVIIRYRVYKEIYWLCCQSITVMYGMKKEFIKEKYVKQVFYKTLKKKGKSFYENGEFSKSKYVKKNLFSSETLYFAVHIFITSLVFGLSVGLIFSIHIALRITLGVVCGIAVFLILAREYFVKCIEVYQPLIDNLKESLKKTFSKAWFLHFDID